MKGIGPKRVAAFHHLDLFTLEDLLSDAPLRYEDRSQVTSIGDLTDGMRVVRGRFVTIGRVVYLGGKRSLLRCEIEDATGTLAVVWHNQPYRARNLRIGDSFYFYGAYQKRSHTLLDPVMEKEGVSDESHFLRLEPVYALTEGLSQRIRRQAVEEALKKVPLGDFLPEEWVSASGMEALPQHYAHLHFPESTQQKDRAVREAFRRRAIVDVLASRVLAKERRLKRSPHFQKVSLTPILSQLPYTLTRSQQAAVETILQQLIAPEPMNCLLQGEVGSGKTIVAFLIAYVTLANGYSVAMMAPTEVLARQHAEKAAQLFDKSAVYLLTGSTSPSRRRSILEEAEKGKAGFYMGTHALFQEAIAFRKLGLVITDEQHRFGVQQRARLQEKMQEPNTLVLSATPIPRTMELIRWGDLNCVRLHGRPPGRRAVVTRIISKRMERDAYAGIGRQVALGHQAYIVCPLIEAGSQDLAYWSVEKVIDRVRGVFQNATAQGKSIVVASLTGQNTPEEKADIMRRFQKNEIAVLVSTTVIEVGVDVSNATVMMIVGADRFGLAQLHQLRGRVGRGTADSYCLLLPHSVSPSARRRLEILAQTEDGFAIAKRDLIERGAGSRLGTAQHGILQTEEEFAQWEAARQWAQKFLQKQRYSSKQEQLPKSLRDRVEKKLASIRKITLN